MSNHTDTPIKRYGKNALKLGLGAILVTYVLRSKMIDFALVQSLLRNPMYLLIAFAFQGFSAFCCSVRWFLLVRAQGLNIGLGSLIELTMIGNFFNTFMPGSVGGDLIKAYYVAGHEPQRKTKAIFTVLVDRIIGLAVIVFYSAATLLFYTEWIAGRPQLHIVAVAIWGFTAACITFAAIFYVPGLWELTGFAKLMEMFKRWEKLYKICDAAVHYQHHLSAIFFSIGLSAVSVLGVNILYKIQGDALGIPMTLPQYFFVVPLALTASAVPILPGGIGVGQVAFFTLFSWTGMANPQQGASLCTVLQAYTILFNCLGAIFYLKYKKKPQSGKDREICLPQKRSSFLARILEKRIATSSSSLKNGA